MPNMTPVDPKGINAAGRVSLYFVPAIADPKNPKLTEITAGWNISMAVYAWDSKPKQDKQERWRYASKSGGNTLSSVTYEPDDLQYDYNPQDTSGTGDYAHIAAMVEGTQGYLVDRRGLGPDIAPAADQVVDIYPVTLGAQTPMAVDPKASGETLRYSQAVAISGDVVLRAKIVT